MDINQVTNASQLALSKEGANTVSHAKTDPSANNSAEDSVKLTPEGTILNGLQLGKLEWGKAFTTLPPIPHTAQELGTWFDDYQKAVRESVQKLFTQNDIQLQQPVTLQNGKDGSVQVDGQHPQAQAIQQVVNNNPQVASQLKSLNQRSELFNVLAHGNNLRQASNDGEHSQAAAALAAHLNNPPPFQLTVNPGSTPPPAEPQPA